MPLFLMQPTTENYEITLVKKFWTHETPMRKYFGLTKYPHEKIWDPRNNHKKRFETQDIPTRKNLVTTKYPREKICDPRNTHEKIFWTHEIPTKTRWHPQQHNGTMALNPRDPDGKQPTKFSTLSILFHTIVYRSIWFGNT